MPSPCQQVDQHVSQGEEVFRPMRKSAQELVKVMSKAQNHFYPTSEDNFSEIYHPQDLLLTRCLRNRTMKKLSNDKVLQDTT